MQAQAKRRLKDGSQYDKLIPKPEMQSETIKLSAGLEDTLKLIKEVVRETLHQTKALASKLKGNTLEQTCKNIWDFQYEHIQYKLDTAGKEEIHSPARIWRERQRGVDCDDYAVLTSSILSNLKIPHSLRLGEYNNKGYFQHIYVIVPYGRGKYYTIDPVKDAFNAEHPFTKKRDLKMDLVYLSGFGNTPTKLSKWEKDFIIEQSRNDIDARNNSVLNQMINSGNAERHLPTLSPVALEIYQRFLVDNKFLRLDQVGTYGTYHPLTAGGASRAGHSVAQIDEIIAKASEVQGANGANVIKPKFGSKEWFSKNKKYFIIAGATAGAITLAIILLNEE